ncbi:MAG: response regulator, partial [Clostridiales bacterium]|nr:response regulator [Clostridiales bacterium]
MDITADYLKANKYTLKCMCVSLIVMVTCWTLNVFKIFIIDQKIMDRSLLGVIIFIALGFVIKFTLGFERSVSNYLMLFLFVGMITFVNMFISYHVTLFMVFPMVCSILYNKTRYVRYTFILVCIGLFVSVLIGYSVGLCDANMLVLTTSTKATEAARLESGNFEINSNYLLLTLFFVVPRVMAVLAFTSVLKYLTLSIQIKTQHEQESLHLAETERLANQAKSAFLAQMSHEIRTPINAVLGMNEMILHKASDKEIIDYSRNIKKAGKTLLVLINSILDLSKIEDGKMELLPVKYETADLVENLKISVEQRAKDKGLKFNINTDKDIPAVLFGDDMRISQVIINLLTNAVKYTKKGSVTLDISVLSREGDEITLFVQVIDTGIGIHEDDLPKLFASFERLQELDNRTIEGTGLGLAITTKLLEMMGSELKVKSTYGEGSNFNFTLKQKVVYDAPAEKTAKVSKPKADSDTAEPETFYPKAKVLVVDDNNMNLKVIRNLLGLFKIIPDAESSGAGAISRMRKKEYDIVFMDHMMPEMDGIETLAKLREKNLVPKHTIMIALTANAIVGARKLYMDATFDDYLSKPVELDQLTAMLDKYLPHEEKAPDQVIEEYGEILEFAPESSGSKGSVSVEAEAIENAKKAGLNTEEGISFCANDVPFYLEMLKEFVSSQPDKEKTLNECFANSDWKNYQIHVHALKSNLRSIGAADLSELARTLEKAAEDEDVTLIKEKHGELTTRY